MHKFLRVSHGDFKTNVEHLSYDLEKGYSESLDNSKAAGASSYAIEKYKNTHGAFLCNVDDGPGILRLSEALGYGTRSGQITRYNRFGTGVFQNMFVSGDGKVLLATATYAYGRGPWKLDMITMDKSSLCSELPRLQLTFHEEQWVIQGDLKDVDVDVKVFLDASDLWMLHSKEDVLELANRFFLEDKTPKTGTVWMCNALNPNITLDRDNADVLYNGCSWREGMAAHWFASTEAIPNMFIFGVKVASKNMESVLKSFTPQYYECDRSKIRIQLDDKEIAAQLDVYLALTTYKTLSPASWLDNEKPFVAYYIDGRCASVARGKSICTNSVGNQFYPQHNSVGHMKTAIAIVSNLRFSKENAPYVHSKLKLLKAAQDQVDIKTVEAAKRLWKGEKAGHSTNSSLNRYRKTLCELQSCNQKEVIAAIKPGMLDRDRRKAMHHFTERNAKTSRKSTKRRGKRAGGGPAKRSRGGRVRRVVTAGGGDAVDAEVSEVHAQTEDNAVDDEERLEITEDAATNATEGLVLPRRQTSRPKPGFLYAVTHPIWSKTYGHPLFKVGKREIGKAEKNLKGDTMKRYRTYWPDVEHAEGTEDIDRARMVAWIRTADTNEMEKRCLEDLRKAQISPLKVGGEFILLSREALLAVIKKRFSYEGEDFVNLA